jgi:hypothetical protein
LPRSKKSIPIISRIRIEFYLPKRPGLRRYEVVRDWLIRELTYLRGGTTRVEEAQGTYRSEAGEIIADVITVLWCDFALKWDRAKDRQEAFEYVAKLHLFIRQMLGEEEEILIVLLPVYHFV